VNTIGKNVRRLRAAANLSQVALAKAAGVSQQLISQIENGVNDSTTELPALARALNVSVDAIDPEYVVSPPEDRVPLKGDIGAGAEVLAIEGDGDDTAPAPASTSNSTVAVRVKGDSMFPAYEPGTLLYYSRLLPPEALRNRRAVVQLGDGRIFVKVVRAGSSANTWNLQSLNPLYPEMVDQVVEWAAPIEWVKPLE
jgi:transcriptional regulator with XRE-family HTH domain